jgi:large subunit ribosomal protein L16
MLQPKRTKYRKQQKMRNRGIAYKGSTISFGSFALKSTEHGRLTARQIESARIALTRYMKREGKVWILVFPDKPISKKPLEVRMGKGKGAVDHYVCQIQPGRILFEVDGVPEATAYEALRLAAQKLPVLTKTVTRPDYAA